MNPEKYNHSTSAVHPLNIGSIRKPKKSNYKKRQNNPVIREEVQILDVDRYNNSTRAVHPHNIGSTRKMTKIQMYKKNKIIHHLRGSSNT